MMAWTKTPSEARKIADQPQEHLRWGHPSPCSVTWSDCRSGEDLNNMRKGWQHIGQSDQLVEDEQHSTIKAHRCVPQSNTVTSRDTDTSPTVTWPFQVCRSKHRANFTRYSDCCYRSNNNKHTFHTISPISPFDTSHLQMAAYFLPPHIHPKMAPYMIGDNYEKQEQRLLDQVEDEVKAASIHQGEVQALRESGWWTDLPPNPCKQTPADWKPQAHDYYR